MRTCAPLRIGTSGAPDSVADQLAEVRVVPDDDHPRRVARLAEHALQLLEPEAVREPGIERERETQALGHDLGGLRGPDLGRGDDRVGLEADAGQEAPQPVGLLLTLLREGPGLVGTLPRCGIAGVRVADEMQLGHGRVPPVTAGAAGPCEGHGLRSSTSPVTR